MKIYLKTILLGLPAMGLLASCGDEKEGENKVELPQQDFTEFVDSTEIKMVYVEGGIFQMGATAEQETDAEGDEKPVHYVALNSFYIGKYEVTQAQWKAVMGTNRSLFTGDDLPVENVNWNDAQEFCKKLSAKTGKKYVLPTEAQWEFAARGGRKSKGFKYCGSDKVADVAWISSNSESQTHPVGKKKGNELGIFDMSGNVWEWCSDRYESIYRDTAVYTVCTDSVVLADTVIYREYKKYTTDSVVWNPTGPKSGWLHVNRGGGWHSPGEKCRVANREYLGADIRHRYLGFRVVCLP